VATATLQADGLNVNQVTQVSSDTPGTVISTNPGANSLVKKGDTVTLKVAKVAPPVQVTVPDGLVNTTQGNATAILQSAGLTATIVNKVSSAQKGTVLSTNPTSGTKINQGSAVTLTVSSGPANAIVPSLIGLSQPVAGQTLASAGLVVGNITPVSSTQFAPGIVVSSNPGTGAGVPPGSSVDIAVSSGPPPTTTTTTTVPPTTTTSSSSTSTTTKVP
jgi:serine/threonine-protein kinase